MSGPGGAGEKEEEELNSEEMIKYFKSLQLFFPPLYLRKERCQRGYHHVEKVGSGNRSIPGRGRHISQDRPCRHGDCSPSAAEIIIL